MSHPSLRTVAFWTFLAVMLGVTIYLVVSIFTGPETLIRCVAGCGR